MYKIIIHIENKEVYCDNEVSAEITLPHVPRRGEILYIDQSISDLLLEKAKSSLKIAMRYAPYWFYPKSETGKNITEADLEKLSFDDAIRVSQVAYKSNSDEIHIELNDSE